MTFNEKIDAMVRDLSSIAHRMNCDGSHRIATRAQAAVEAVAALRADDSEWFADLDWKWKPGKG